MTDHRHRAQRRRATRRDAINVHDPARIAACFTEDDRCERPLHRAESFVGSDQVRRSDARGVCDHHQKGRVIMPSNLTEPLARNAAFAQTDAKDKVPEIPFIPNRQLYLITCIDPRVDPSDTLGLALGDAIVARNVGGRVSPSLIKDLTWIVHLHEHVTPDADWFEIAVIHHTDCGSALLANDELRAGYVARGGWDDATSQALAVTEPHQTVREDVEKIRTAPELRPGLEHVRVGGYVYDVKTGQITTVVEPA